MRMLKTFGISMMNVTCMSWMGKDGEDKAEFTRYAIAAGCTGIIAHRMGRTLVSGFFGAQKMHFGSPMHSGMFRPLNVALYLPLRNRIDDFPSHVTSFLQTTATSQ